MNLKAKYNGLLNTTIVEAERLAYQEKIDLLDLKLKINHYRVLNDLKLDKKLTLVPYFHVVNLFKKLMFAMVLVFGYGNNQLQVWLLFILQLVFTIFRMYLRPYLSKCKNICSIICDCLTLFAISTRLVFIYAYKNISSNIGNNNNIATWMNVGWMLVFVEWSILII
jgi:hypothetical protein